jgi:hypothetical protein
MTLGGSNRQDTAGGSARFGFKTPDGGVNIQDARDTIKK